jgi:hypothetical protein
MSAHRRFAAVIVAAVAVAALAATDVRVESAPLARNSAAANVYDTAYRAQSLADGSRFVIYRSPAASEPSALAAALIGSNGSLLRMKAADWIAAEDLAPHTVGQIYAASMAADHKTMAVSIGWRHVKNGGTNAVAILRRNGDAWHFSHLIRGLGSVGDVLLTKTGLLIAVTGNRERGIARGTQPPLLTVLTTGGRVLAEGFPAAAAGDELETYRNASRIVALRRGYAFFDAERGRAITFALDNERSVAPGATPSRNVDVVYPSKDRLRLLVKATTTLRADARRADALIEDAHVADDGTVAIVRSTLPQENDGIATSVTIQSPGGVSRNWHPAGFWKPVFWENNRLVGIARGATPEADLTVHRVTFVN